MDPHHTVKQSDKILKTNWRKVPYLPDKYSAYSDRFIKVPTEFENMWDGQLGFTEVVQHRIKLGKTDNWRTHQAAYPKVPKVRAFEKQKRNLVLSMDCIGLTKTEWASPIVFRTR